MHIDHTTIRTRQLEKTRDFLISIFDLTEGPRPAIIAANIPGYWLYHNESPLIHLIKSSFYYKQQIDQAAEAIDHTAFYMEDYDAFKQKLLDLNVPHSLMDLPDIGERRIFLHTPTGILLKTVFRELFSNALQVIRKIFSIGVRFTNHVRLSHKLTLIHDEKISDYHAIGLCFHFLQKREHTNSSLK